MPDSTALLCPPSAQADLSQAVLRRTLAIMLAGGRGQRLYPLTRSRPKPTVPFGGVFRVADFTISNCLNSGVRRIAVLGRYRLDALMRQQWRWQNMCVPFAARLRLLSGEGGPNPDLAAGSAGAVTLHLSSIESTGCDLVLVLAGDHIYRMDYGPMLEFHLEAGAPVTVGAVEVGIEEASAFGVLEVDGEGRVLSFVEKPEQPVSSVRDPRQALVSMGIYVFDRRALSRILRADSELAGSTHDFGRDIMPHLVDRGELFAFRFDRGPGGRSAYWRDVGSIGSYFAANLDLLHTGTAGVLLDPSWPVLPNEPRELFLQGEGNVFCRSLVSVGCRVSTGTVRDSVLSPGVVVGDGAEVFQSILLSNVRVGRGARVRGAIVEENVTIGDGETVGRPRAITVVEREDRGLVSRSPKTTLRPGTALWL